jgi:IS5 family transposase
MKQQTFVTVTGFEKHNRKTRKEAFLSRMEVLAPWSEFCALIEPHDLKVGNGRPSVGLKRMLRMYFLANGFNLADEACEEALSDVPLFREFCRMYLGQERIPDATTLLKFRHLLEAHDLGAALFAKVSEKIESNRQGCDRYPKREYG